MLKKFILTVTTLFFTFFGLNNFVAAREIEQVPHWTKSQISVYIPEGANAAQVKRAFNSWQEESFGKLKFIFVDKGPADIDVVFSQSTDNSTNHMTSSSYSTTGNEITKGEIHLSTNGEQPDIKDSVYKNLLYEVGHVLGLPDNDRKKSSIMNSSNNDKNVITKKDIVKLYSINNWSYMHRNF